VKPRKPDKRGQQAPPQKDPHGPQSFVVEGLAALGEYARFKPEAILEVHCKDSSEAAVRQLLASAGVQVRLSPPPEKPGVPTPPVQARVKLKALEFHDVEPRFAPRSRDVIVALDHITDPRNLGAIMRSASFFGVREVIAPERRQVLLTQASVATAQGGFALTDLVCVTNLARTLATLKDLGYWIIGTAMDGEAVQALAGTYQKVVLVLGAEDVGLSKLIREKCDRLAAIPGRPGGLDSLNVSVAAGIFLSALATS
jgi:23S rRNA (guanosine2251-2'-O)-methyltransferase